MLLRKIARLFTFFLLLAGLQACLRDDFNKLAESEWSPDLAFPLVYSELDVNDLLIQDKSPTQIIADAQGLVRIIYNSDNFSDRAENIINLPQPELALEMQFQTNEVSAFNLSGPGAQIFDSVQTNISYSLDADLGSASRLDTVVFKSGELRLKFKSLVPHPASVRLTIPNLLVSSQGLLQAIELEAAPAGGTELSFSRNLSGAVLINGVGETVEVKMTTLINKSGEAVMNSQTHTIEADIEFNNCAFSRISGYFGNLQMPMISNDTLQLRLFKNAISASSLEFERASTEFRVQNSTGLPFSYNLQELEAYRGGQNIPNLDLSVFSFPAMIDGSNLSMSQQVYLFNETNSNFANIINQFPIYTFAQQSFVPIQNPSQSYRLRDSSRFRVHQQTILPLNGLTLDFQLRDTFEFDFSEINRDIEEVLLRLNISNGFPLSGLLDVYFCRQSENQTNAPLVYLDSLYTTENTEVMDAPAVNSAGEAIELTNQITDVVVAGTEWQKLKTLNCNRIVIRARLNSSGTTDVRILDDDLLRIRIGARIKLRKKF